MAYLYRSSLQFLMTGATTVSETKFYSVVIIHYNITTGYIMSIYFLKIPLYNKIANIPKKKFQLESENQ
jgi:hypothetical protein